MEVSFDKLDVHFSCVDSSVGRSFLWFYFLSSSAVIVATWVRVMHQTTLYIYEDNAGWCDLLLMFNWPLVEQMEPMQHTLANTCDYF